MANDSKNIDYLDINSIQPNPLQPRGAVSPKSLLELVDSIKEHGILEPLVIAHTPVGFQIIAGERRWRAAKMAGLKNVPCIVKETTPKNMLEMALVENVQREDLNALDRAKAFDRLKNEFNLSSSLIAKRIGKSSSYISNTLRLLDLPDLMKDALLSNHITEGHARAIQSIGHLPSMIEAYKIILRQSASVRKAEEIARRIKDDLQKRGIKKVARQGGLGNRKIVSDEIDKMVKKLEKSLGKAAKVKLIRTAKQTRLTIILDGAPIVTEKQLQGIYQSLVNQDKNNKV